MKKILCILLSLPTVCFAQNDIATPPEWTPAFIVFFSLLAMAFLWIANAIFTEPEPDYIVRKPRRNKYAKNYEHIEELNKAFYNEQRKKKTNTTKQIADSIDKGQPFVQYTAKK